MYFIAIANIIVVMNSPNILEVVKDLMALTVISEIDDYFAQATSDCFALTICEKDSEYTEMFKINVTTSKQAITNLAQRRYGNRKLEDCSIHEKALEHANEMWD